MSRASGILAQPEHSLGRLLDSAKLQGGLSRSGRRSWKLAPPLGFYMTLRTRLLASLIACAALVAPHSAQAEATAAEISAAKNAFESALVAEGEQRWADAGLKLREAIAVKDTPGLRFHLAHCETELGHLLEASFEYDRALELLRRGAKAPDVQKLLGPARAELMQRIPRLGLEIPADAPAVRASIDGLPYPPSELALGVPLNPGPHEVRVQATGRQTFERALNLKEGQRLALPVALPLTAPAEQPGESVSAAPPPVNPPRPAPPPPAPSSSSSKVYLMIGESVLTAAGLGIGIGYAVARGAATERIESAQGLIDSAAPGNAQPCDPSDAELSGACSDLDAAIQDHDRAARISRIGFVTAGVGAAALLTTWLVFPSQRAQAAGFSIQPMAGLGRLGVFGRF